nr:MAG: hypothetical protein [Caudoviricetes sp.]
MTIYVDLPSLIFFVITVVCGILYGMHCFRTGLSRGADNMIEMLIDQGIIDVDEETGEILPAKGPRNY